MEDQRRPLTTWLAVLALAVAGCTQTKSSTPTSPLIAGPIAGVEITAPRPLVPLSGATILAEGQAVSLVVDNATTNGVRPLSYTFQVGTDAGFGTLAFSAEGVPPGGDGRTGVTVSTLDPGRTYHWRARALDGANTGPFSDPRHFEYREPVVIFPPEAIEPVGGTRTSSRQPTLRTRNAARTGPAGAMTYEFQVSADASFAGIVFILTEAEQPSSTQASVNVQLEQNRTYYWRVRAREATTTGPWSSTNAFVTPLPVTTPPPPPTTTPPPGTPPPPQGTGMPSASEGTAMVAFVVADLQARGISILGDCGAFEVTKRVAWHFRDRGAGLERKTGGRRCEDASIDILLFNDGTSVDILVGAGIDNGPAWQTHPPYDGWQAFWVAPYNPEGDRYLTSGLSVTFHSTGIVSGRWQTLSSQAWYSSSPLMTSTSPRAARARMSGVRLMVTS